MTLDIMDIDDETTLQDITFQVVEFRKEQTSDNFYEKSSNVCMLKLIILINIYMFWYFFL